MLRCRPAVFYFRRALRESRTLGGYRRVGLWAVDELEYCKAQMRAAGLIPMRLYDPKVIGPDGEILEDERRLGDSRNYLGWLEPQ